MPKFQSDLHSKMPNLWLISDLRNDKALEKALKQLPRGSGFIYRHYHLPPETRRKRFQKLSRLARLHGHHLILAGSQQEAHAWYADGSYGATSALNTRANGPQHTPRNTKTNTTHKRPFLTLFTVHSMRELRLTLHATHNIHAAIFLSPVFPTRSHPNASTLGPIRFRLLAKLSPVPIIALGGINKRTNQRLKWPRWGAIDGFGNTTSLCRTNPL